MKPLIIIFGSTDVLCGVNLRSQYSEAILRAGGVPLLVPMKQKKDGLEQIVEIADGFMFAGGDDIDPEYYGEKKLNSSVEVQPIRDEMEREAYEIIRKTDKPVLGICRGIQAINVFHGGTLYQDLPAQYTSTVYHRQTQSSYEPTHRVNIKKGSLLHGILNSEQIMTNSHHHQSVKTVGEGLEVCGVCEDGLTEALYSPTHPFLLLVQWHPEYGYDKYPAEPIFTAFVNACKKSLK